MKPGQHPFEGSTKSCNSFQLDLSCLVDGELGELAACRAMEHLEGCGACRGFFEETRLQVQLHKDVADPSRLLVRFSELTGRPADAEASELVYRLASIFYKIGKAYVLTAIEPGYGARIFEKAVEIESAKLWGRGYVDGVLSRGAGGSHLSHARHMLNGQLSRIEGALEKGKRLLEESLALDPEHEEARLYQARVHAHEGKTLRAEKQFTQVFDSALDENNRGHAAVQLGRLYFAEGEYEKAISFLRWVTISGLADREERFFVVRFNIGMYYAHWRKPAHALRYFRELLDCSPDRVGEVAGFFARAPKLRAVIDSQPGFTEQLVQACPEIFGGPPTPGGAAGLQEDSP